MELILSVIAALSLGAAFLCWRRADAVEHENAALKEELGKKNQELGNKEIQIAKLEAGLKSAEEEKKRLTEVRESMKAEFKSMSQTLLEEKRKQIKDDSKDFLDPLNKELQKFRERMDAIHTEDSKERVRLQTEITSLQKQAKDIGGNAENLARALKGDSKVQGDWGEVQLTIILEKSGLTEGTEYKTQESVRGEDGSLLRTDVTVFLPDDKHLIVDSKVSLRNYTDHVSAQDENERDAALKRHVDAVRAHVKNLSGKHYQNASGFNSPDFVFLFMPVEPAFLAALKEDPDLFSYAYKQKIVLCSPTSIMAILRTVESLWRIDRQNKNTQEIAEQGRKLYDKFFGFVEDMKSVRGAFDKASETLEKAESKLHQGRGNLVGQANKLLDLGVKTGKPRIHLDE